MVTTEIFSILVYCSLKYGALAAFWAMLNLSKPPILHWSNLRLDVRRKVFMDTRPKSFRFRVKLPFHSRAPSEETASPYAAVSRSQNGWMLNALTSLRLYLLASESPFGSVTKPRGYEHPTRIILILYVLRHVHVQFQDYFLSSFSYLFSTESSGGRVQEAHTNRSLKRTSHSVRLWAYPRFLMSRGR